jgi:uncharacterized membrane protein YeiH
MPSLLATLDLLGVLVFALSGALTASRKELDIVGFAFVAAVTGLGGGTLRDLLLDLGPVFWVHKPPYLAVTTAAAILVFLTAHRVEVRYRLLLWADALGLALFCVVGARIARDAGAPAPVAVLMGMTSAVMGGLLRDIICNELPLVLRRELYWTPALLGAVVAVGADAAGLAEAVAGLLGFLAAFGLRAAGLLLDLSLPAYRARPGRPWGRDTSPRAMHPPPEP